MDTAPCALVTGRAFFPRQMMQSRLPCSIWWIGCSPPKMERLSMPTAGLDFFRKDCGIVLQQWLESIGTGMPSQQLEKTRMKTKPTSRRMLRQNSAQPVGLSGAPNTAADALETTGL